MSSPVSATLAAQQEGCAAEGSARPPPPRVCVRCISDLHADWPENCRWIQQLPERRGDVLIVAGDISDDLVVARTALRTLRGKYAEVFCVPGNHDLWLPPPNRRGSVKDSMQKLRDFLTMCAEEGVRTRPCCVGGGADGSGVVCILPLLSWHHQSFDTEPDTTCWEGIPPIEVIMMDYRRCVWPAPLRMDDDSVARAVDELNNGTEAALPTDAGREGGPPIISFSHFLPRLELSPEKRYLFLPTLNKAVGSSYLGERVRRLGSAAHIFGHTHYGWDAELEGTRYIQAALGYPEEWVQRPFSMEIGELQRELPRREPMVVWDSQSGFVPQAPAFWSDHYRRKPRRPELCHQLAPYAAELYRRLPGGEISEWPP